MHGHLRSRIGISLLLSTTFLTTPLLVAGQSVSTPPAERIGVFDSRVVAYAHFWSEEELRKRHEWSLAARAAKEAGDTVRFEGYRATLKETQKRSHLQVFSTAPVDDLLAKVKDRLPEVQKQKGVTRLVSKWDERTLAGYPTAERVDVTESMAALFIKPNVKQARTMEQIKNTKPLALWKAKLLLTFGGL